MRDGRHDLRGQAHRVLERLRQGLGAFAFGHAGVRDLVVGFGDRTVLEEFRARALARLVLLIFGVMLLLMALRTPIAIAMFENISRINLTSGAKPKIFRFMAFT